METACEGMLVIGNSAPHVETFLLMETYFIIIIYNVEKSNHEISGTFAIHHQM